MTNDTPRLAQGQSQPVSYRWRQPGNKHWIYDPTPEWIEDHKHEIELEALYLAALAPGNGAVEADRKVDGLAKMQATEDADIDFVLGRLGLATSAGCNREIIRNFRKQIIQMAASEATHPAALDPVTVEALRPFAVLADMAHKDHRDSRPFIFAFDTAVAQRLTIGDLRRAKAALIGQPASNGEPIK
jgi:hypothetical protein